MNKSLLTTLSLLFLSITGYGQIGGNTTGSAPFGNTAAGVNLANLNITVSIPIRTKGGFSAHLEYNTNEYQNNGAQWQAAREFGIFQFVTNARTVGKIPQPGHNCTGDTAYLITLVDNNGYTHSWPDNMVDNKGCVYPLTSTGPDAYGWIVSAQCNSSTLYCYATVTDLNGTVYAQPSTSNNFIYTTTDSNGNQITYDAIANKYTDYTGNAVLSGNYCYNDQGGTQRCITPSNSIHSVTTSFGCQNIAEMNNVQLGLTDSISLPDGSSYSFTYYTDGRLHTETLPTGGVITYVYNGPNGGINCGDWGGSGFTRQTPDGTATYTRSYISQGTYGQFKTVVKAPSGQTETLLFAGGTGQSFEGIPPTNNDLEVSRVNAESNGTVVGTVVTCYNGNTAMSTCASANNITTAIPSEVTQFTQLPNASGRVSEVDTAYNFVGLPTTVTKYGVGSGAPGGKLEIDTVAYGGWNGSTCVALNNNIHTKPCYRLIQNGNSGNESLTYFAYDQTTPSGLTGTTNHVSVTGSRGNLTTKYASVGTSTLNTVITNYDTGAPKKVTEPNGAFTTYNYSNASNTCGNRFPDSVSLPMGLSTSTTWDCNGGMATGGIDANSKPWSQANADVFWRLTSTTDQTGAQTTLGYGPQHVESTLSVNSGSVVDTTAVLDTLGRQIINQIKQSPSATQYDTVQEYLDTNARAFGQSLPCAAVFGVGCSASTASTTYDALDRPLVTTDAGGGTLTNQYIGNDVLVTVGPPPTGENIKSKQYEYDGLGRLTSVCEVTSSANGGTPCGQNNPQTGFLTTYAYNTVSTRSLTVTQGTQTRTYVYDNLGRLTSETNPESGMTTYIYDSDPSVCKLTYNGDLIRQSDANGNNICHFYDGLHRLTDEGNYVNGAYVSGSCRRFRYDNSTGVAGSIPSGVTVTNVMGHMVEAETDSCNPYPPTAPITDEWFSYSARGELSDVYELTPQSGGVYYHTTAAYAANGTLASLSGIPGYTAITYGLDGEGRLSTAVQGTSKIVCDSSCSPASTTYYPGGQPHVVTIGGTTDSDNYTYDNMGRMTNYTFTVGSTPTSITGGLTWNPNGTLNKLQISDGFNAGGTQTCNYGTTSTPGYDDLGRLLNVNCGSLWSQAFSYDRFGNISKTGSLSWACATCYNGNNQYNTTLSPSISYDNDGNLRNDTFHTYTWEPYGHVSTIDSTACGTNGRCLTYDALGRLVEESVNANYTETVYSPVGRVALMNGQTTSSAFFPLPAGESIYETGSTGVGMHFQHKDWLGTARFASGVTNRVLYYDLAYAPFGEAYDKFGTNAGNIFAGQTEDTISGTYDTPNRELNPSQGRWISPDPGGLNVVDMTNPQSWNRYAYVLNNPLSLTDPLGLWCVWDDGTGHDADPSEGGFNKDQCADAGGHWDPFDTITNIWQTNGYVTQIAYTASGMDYTFNPVLYGFTLSGLDSTLQTYSVLGVSPSDQLNAPDFVNSLGPLHVQFQTIPNVTWSQWGHAAYDCLKSPDPLPNLAKQKTEAPSASAETLGGNSLDKSNTVYLPNGRGQNVPVTGQTPPGMDAGGNAAGLLQGWENCMHQELGIPR